MDTIARVLAPKLGEALGQQFVIENRPGASGGVAAEALAGAQPDGHVLMLAESGTLALPSVNPKRSTRCGSLRRWAACACCRWRSS